MPEHRGSITVDASPDEAWKLISDVGSLDQWMPMIEACEWDGESRTLTLAGGLGTLVEKVLSLDHDARTLVYTITEAPFTPDKYVATWTVEPEGGGARVTWSMDVEPPEIGELLAGSIDGALQAVKSTLES